MHPEMRAIDYIKEAGEYLQTATGERITASQMCEKFYLMEHFSGQ